MFYSEDWVVLISVNGKRNKQPPYFLYPAFEEIYVVLICSSPNTNQKQNNKPNTKL